MDKKELKEAYLGGIFTAIAFVLPIGFHALGLGSAFLPMLLPILYLGFVVRPKIVISAAVVAPLLSSLLTGMPPLFPPIAAVLIIEGIVLGGGASLMYNKLKLNFWAALIVSVVSARLISYIVLEILALFFSFPPKMLGLSVLVSTLPGTILQLTIVPTAYFTLKNKMK